MFLKTTLYYMKIIVCKIPPGGETLSGHWHSKGGGLWPPNFKESKLPKGLSSMDSASIVRCPCYNLDTLSEMPNL